MPLGMPSFYDPVLPDQAKKQALMRFLGSFGPQLLGVQAAADPGGAIGRGLGAGFNAYDGYLAQAADFRRQQELDEVRRRELQQAMEFRRQQLAQGQERVDLSRQGLESENLYRSQRIEQEEKRAESASKEREEDVKFREERLKLEKKDRELRERELNARLQALEDSAKGSTWPMKDLIDDARQAASDAMSAEAKDPNRVSDVPLPSFDTYFQSAFNALMPQYIQAYGLPPLLAAEQERQRKELERIRSGMPDRMSRFLDR